MSDDYMSDDFLQQLPDIRPGLIRGVGKRKLEAHTRHQAAKRAIKEEQQAKKKNAKDKLMEGLQTNVISEDNPGFKMMQKMGFKQGAGLGKQGEGRAEPIQVDPFQDRSGLGRAAEVEENTRKKLKTEKARFEAFKRNEAVMLRQFRDSKKQEAKLRKFVGLVRKCQKVCRQMDEKDSLQPPEVWYWPLERKLLEQDEQEQDDSEEPQEPPPDDIFPELDTYLRYTHCYCVWCGVKYTDREDMIRHCPGNTEDEHDELSGADFNDDR